MRAFRKERVPVWWPVTVTEAADHGTVETFEFEARLLPFTPSELREIARGAVLGTAELVDVIARQVVDWTDVINPETKEAIPYSEERLRQEMEQSTDLLRGLQEALMDVSSGGGERKNSRTSRAH